MRRAGSDGGNQRRYPQEANEYADSVLFGYDASNARAAISECGPSDAMERSTVRKRLTCDVSKKGATRIAGTLFFWRGGLSLRLAGVVVLQIDFTVLDDAHAVIDLAALRGLELEALGVRRRFAVRILYYLLTVGSTRLFD